jgi:hypothetical protein
MNCRVNFISKIIKAIDELRFTLIFEKAVKAGFSFFLLFGTGKGGLSPDVGK